MDRVLPTIEALFRHIEKGFFCGRHFFLRFGFVFALHYLHNEGVFTRIISDMGHFQQQVIS